MNRCPCLSLCTYTYNYTYMRLYVHGYIDICTYACMDTYKMKNTAQYRKQGTEKGELGTSDHTGRNRAEEWGHRQRWEAEGARVIWTHGATGG